MAAARAASVPLWLRIAGTILLLAAAYLACRNTVVLLLGRAAPQVAVRIPPAAGEPLVRMHLGSSSATPEAARDAIRRGLGRAPLSELPFLLAAEQARASGSVQRSSSLAKEAVRRQSRNEYGRGRMLQIHLQRGRWNEALDEMRMLWRAHSGSHPLMLRAMLLMASQDQRARGLLVRKLSEDKGLRKSFFAAAHKIHRGNDFVAALRSESSEPASADPTAPTAAGYRSWIRSLPAAELPRVGGIFDGGFESGRSGAPFEWRLAHGRTASASPVPNGLAVMAREGAPRRIAVQNLLLPRAAFVLETTHQRPTSGTLVWTLRCQGGRELLALPLGQSASPQQSKARFTVPGGCPVQQLALTAAAGQEPLQATVERVEVVPDL